MPATAQALPRVLVIDDELGPRESLRILLKDEFDVHCVDSVAEGIGVLEAERPQVVIMDIRMPGQNGIEGLKEIRTIDKTVSVVMLTGYGSLATAQEAIRLGANDYLDKPFDTHEMKKVVHRYAQRSVLELKRNAILDELREMNDSLVKDLADKEHMASLGQMSKEFTHDLRNPLMIVSGYVELLSSQIAKVKDTASGEYEQVSEYLDVIQNNVRRCCDLATMWQKFGRSELNKFSDTPISQIMKDVAASAEPLAMAQEVRIEYDFDATDKAVVKGSRAQLIRAIHNVVANAIQATPSGSGLVRVSYSCREEQANISVEDNGCGMSPEVMDRIFEPHFTTKHQKNGNGLGLFITSKIIEDHNGTIDVQSEPQQGTTMALRLPLARTLHR